LRKVYIAFAIMMIAVLLGTVGCAAAPSQLEPATVQFGYVSNEWAGMEVVGASVFVTINNPNPVPVTLSSLDYKLIVRDTQKDTPKDIPVATKTMAPNLMIPANGSISMANVSCIDFSSTLAVNPYYLAQAMAYVPAHIMAVPVWKLLGGKEPYVWAYPAVNFAGILTAGPTVDAIKAGTADMASAVKQFATARGTYEAIQSAMDGAWKASSEGPCTYVLQGKATINYGTLSKDTEFDLTYVRP
jgi:hypothetical protein